MQHQQHGAREAGQQDQSQGQRKPGGSHSGIAGRAFRFLLEGYFAVRYGPQAKEILAKYYPFIGLGLVAAILLFVIVKQRRLIRLHPRRSVANSGN